VSRSGGDVCGGCHGGARRPRVGRHIGVVDGGWGVDALVREQTRDHDDLDLVVSLVDCDLAMRSLQGLGFALYEDERPTRFVLGDEHDRRIDFHTVSFDDIGDGYQVLPDGSAHRYRRTALTGRGRIGNRHVRCLTGEAQIECHLGYEPDEGIGATCGRWPTASSSCCHRRTDHDTPPGRKPQTHRSERRTQRLPIPVSVPTSVLHSA